MMWVFWIADIFSIILFSLLVIHAWRRGIKYVAELFAGYIYGLFLEIANIYIFGTYFYSKNFLFEIEGVPVAVALGWSGIIYSSMGISDTLEINEWSKPFFDAILAIFIDLSMDAIAIRLGYWSWGIPYNEGWFGVPAGNFVGWMYVVFFFSLLSRILRRKIKSPISYSLILIFVLPIVSYAFMALSLYVTMVGLIYLFNLYDYTAQLWIFVLQFSIFSIVVIWSISQKKIVLKEIDFHYKLVPLSFHIYYISVFMLLKLYSESILLAVSVFFFFLINELVIEFPTIYKIFHKIK
ncbi:MAG: carotenoid biosynthesis protein [Candidatus Asgardarchaeia archaeon]